MGCSCVFHSLVRSVFVSVQWLLLGSGAVFLHATLLRSKQAYLNELRRTPLYEHALVRMIAVEVTRFPASILHTVDLEQV